jgi:putative peptidoglycan lipid II flippase
VESPLVRGGLTLAGGILVGNVVGFLRVALTAYLLGTHTRADSLAVALGPLDTVNSVLTNSLLFAFVPMLAARAGAERAALLIKLRRAFLWVFALIAIGVVSAAPWLMRLLAPGLGPDALRTAVNLLRILSISTAAAGVAALYTALLYTDRRFAPTAFYQASLNVFTILAAVSLWKWAGVYAFAIGYSAGACAQLAIVSYVARSQLKVPVLPKCPLRWGEILGKPAFFLVYAAGLGLNITFTRAYATHAGSGMAAALEYCIRCVGVPLALLVQPFSNSLLPEIARLRSLSRLWEAGRLIARTMVLAALAAVAVCGLALLVQPFSNSLLPEIARLRSLSRLWEAGRLIARTMVLAALAAVAVCGLALLLRHIGIMLMFQRGSFTADSTDLVAAVFLGLGPSLVGWSLMEILSRSLFALDHRWPPVIAAFIPVVVNVTLTLRIFLAHPLWIGVGASLGTLAGFAALLLLALANRRRWLIPA